ncbi:hypothetical protein ACOMHN_057404 [Nucella lapillus]
MKSNQEVYKLVDLRKLYDNRLHQLGSKWIDEHAHQGRFKEHLLKKLGSGWSDYSKGRDVYISHDKRVGKALEKTAGCQVTEDEADKIVESYGQKRRPDIVLECMLAVSHMRDTH